MEVIFESISTLATKIAFKMLFDTAKNEIKLKRLQYLKTKKILIGLKKSLVI